MEKEPADILIFTLSSRASATRVGESQTFVLFLIYISYLYLYNNVHYILIIKYL